MYNARHLKDLRKKILSAETLRIKNSRRKGIEEQGGELSSEDLGGVPITPIICAI